MKNLVTVFLLFLSALLCSKAAEAQMNRRDRLQLGAALGAGGLHSYAGFSLDLRYKKTYLRVSPGLYFYGAGLTHSAGFFRKANGKDRIPIIFSFYYLDDHLLTDVRRDLTNPNQRRDLDLFMLMAGAHFPFDRLDRYYWEMQVGIMYVRQKFYDYNSIPVPERNGFYPMVEFRIGGFLQLHQNKPQKFKN